MAFVRAFFAVLAALTTLLAVVAIKRGTEAILHTWPMTWVWSFDLVGIAVAIAVVTWAYLLRPALERRKQRQHAGLRESVVGDGAGDAGSGVPRLLASHQTGEDARPAARRGAGQG